jgi:ribosomal protein S18 acetylase RimI-like enzyme
MIKLIPMNEKDFQKYLEWSVKNYADEKIKSGNWSPNVAMERSEQELKRLLPNGLQTTNNYLFSAMEGKANVGMIWIAKRSDDGVNDFIWIYDIVVDPEERGKGYGYEIMKALETKAKELQVSTVKLHVFGHNTTAIALYKKMGYSITNMVMEKRL